MPRAAEVQQRWACTWYWLPVLLIASTLAGFIVAPGTQAEKLLLAMHGTCGVRADHLPPYHLVVTSNAVVFTMVYTAYPKCKTTFERTVERLGLRHWRIAKRSP